MFSMKPTTARFAVCLILCCSLTQSSFAVKPGGNGNPNRGKKPRSAAILVSPTSDLLTTEAGGTAEFNVVLGSQPTADVTINLTSSDSSEGSLDLTSVTFTSTNWDTSQTVTVTGVDDTDPDGSVDYLVNTSPASSTDNNYDSLDPADVSITNIDDDSPVTNTMYVRSFSHDMRQRGKNISFQFTVDVRIDSNNDGVPDGSDGPAAGVQVLVSVYDSDVTDVNNDSNIWNFLGTTNAEGIFRTEWYNKLKSGVKYTIEVHCVWLTDSGYVWDPLDVLESGLGDADKDGRPDFVLPDF